MFWFLSRGAMCPPRAKGLGWQEQYLVTPPRNSILQPSDVVFCVPHDTIGYPDYPKVLGCHEAYTTEAWENICSGDQIRLRHMQSMLFDVLSLRPLDVYSAQTELNIVDKKLNLIFHWMYHANPTSTSERREKRSSHCLTYEIQI